jgi:hypothetical protein
MKYFSVTPENPQDPASVEIVGKVEKILDHLGPKVHEWQIEAFRRARAKSDLTWPPQHLILSEFEALAWAHLNELKST